jgi:hypothetical protein
MWVQFSKTSDSAFEIFRIIFEDSPGKSGLSPITFRNNDDISTYAVMAQLMQKFKQLHNDRQTIVAEWVLR